MKSRKTFVEELKLREEIRKLIKESYDSIVFEKKQSIVEENKLRRNIQLLLKEVKEDEDIPESSTGINVLRDLLKKIVPIIETDYKSLTTSKEQRTSFRSHIIRATKNTLVLGEKDLAQTAKEKDKQDEENKVKGLEELEEQDEGEKEKINVNIGKEEDVGGEQEKFIDINKEDVPTTDLFTISGADTTGRNMAVRTYEKIEKNILDAYSLLGDKEDQQLFTDYLLTNLKLYFDKFEQELALTVSEPTNSVYEKEKNKQSQEEKVGEESALEQPEEIATTSEEEPLTV